MFDYHMHSLVSFDGHAAPEAMVKAAEQAGLQEICFTDHRDYYYNEKGVFMVFDWADFDKGYGNLKSDRVKIRRGMEFGMTTDNQAQLAADAAARPSDFVLGSVHFVDGLDVYFQPYWEGKTPFEAERRFLEHTLACVETQDGFDVLAHLTFLSKAKVKPTPRAIPYEEHRAVIDEILRTLARKGKGLEMNTSGVDRCGAYLPDETYLRRFKELGGEIVTIGSDAHNTDRVGQYSRDACAILKDIFGYVCTFEGRKPIFHQL